MTHEIERKYLISEKLVENVSLYHSLLKELAPPTKFKEYDITGFQSKQRNYRYWDTFDQFLEKGIMEAGIASPPGYLELGGISASLRERENDFILTVKIPTGKPEERIELEYHISSAEADFDAILLENFSYVAAVRKLLDIIPEGSSLQEVVRLEVLTNRYDLSCYGDMKLEVAVDHVTAQGFGGITKNFNGITREFHELEIELRGGVLEDKDILSEYFEDKFRDRLMKSNLPKWIKAMRLIRGEEITPDSEIKST